MKIDFLADTNFLLYVHEGNSNVIPLLNYTFGISFISEVELLGFKGLSNVEEIKLKDLITDCYSIDWDEKIKEQTIKLRKTYNIKLPDAIIASSSIVYGIPLITADKGFNKIRELDLVLIDF